MLEIQHLTKRYGSKVAVDDLTLHIRPGEICGFIGHNGAGKTPQDRPGLSPAPDIASSSLMLHISASYFTAPFTTPLMICF